MTLAKLEKYLVTYVAFAAPAVATAFFAGEHSAKVLGLIALAAVLAPLRRALNPKDKAYGVVSVLDDVVEKAVSKDAPVSKA